MKSILNFIRHHLISFILCGIILYLCMMKSSELPKVDITNMDKWVHCSMGLGLTLCIFFEQSRYYRQSVFLKFILLSSCYTILYGGFIEIMQEYFSSGRTGDWKDFAFNALGAGIGVGLNMIINKYGCKKRKSVVDL